jgi:D-alanine--poly(phosphoribitol) ligase subunit 1
MPYPYNLGRLFANIVKQHADRVAIKYVDRELSYCELDALSDRLAGYLLECGLVTGDLIAIVNTKEPESLALMVACLKLGIAYTNIDRDNPPQRVEAILNQCQPRMVFFDGPARSELVSLCDSLHTVVAELKRIPLKQRQCQAVTAVSDQVTGNRIAYVMFTSGSTGIPKGAVMTHQNVLNFIGWSVDRFQVSPQDVFANISPFYFDNSVFDFYSALFSGASIAPIHKQLLSQPTELLTNIDRLGCTIWFSVPSMLIYLLTMRALTRDRFRSIRCVVFGGEGFPKSELHKLYSLYSNRIEFVNVYGPTEATCICSSYSIGQADFSSLEGLPPLGFMNGNFDYLILDETGSKAKRGELCILGPNVGLGYYRDPEITKRSFVEYYKYGFYGDRMYKTGDLVEERDGLLYFVGRVDNQIKHMGYRIELEEIELALNSLPEVNQAAVIYERVSTAYGKIVAFVASDAGSESAALKEQLRKKLPEYMIPNILTVCTSLPKNANGKVDRKQIREMFRASNLPAQAA